MCAVRFVVVFIKKYFICICTIIEKKNKLIKRSAREHECYLYSRRCRCRRRRLPKTVGTGVGGAAAAETPQPHDAIDERPETRQRG